MGQSVHESIVIYCENISNIMLENSPIYHVKTKHIKVPCHFVRDKILEDIDLVYVSIEDQVVDSLMKALCTENLKEHNGDKE